jgi:hypothetical protein
VASAPPNNDVPRGFKFLQILWPIGLAISTVAVAGVRADAQLGELDKKVDYLYGNGAPPIAARLARIEERQLVLIETTNKINDKLDRMGSSH